MNELKCLAYDRDLDFICITESNFSGDYTDAELDIPNYNIYRNDLNPSGGTCIYVHVRHTVQVLVNKSIRDFMGLTVFLDTGKLHLVCLYRSPSSNVEQDVLVRNELAKLPSTDTDRIILLGDFNLPDVCWVTGSVKGPDNTTDRKLINQQEYLDCIVANGFSWHITNEITRRRFVCGELQESTLDQILTSDPDIIDDIIFGPPLGRSDHLTLEIRLKLYDDASYLTSVKYNWSKCDTAKVVYMGQQTDWFYSGVFDNSVDAQSQELLNKILNIVDNSVPTIKLKTTKEGIPNKKAPWECSKLQHSRKAKDKAWHCFDTSPTHYNLMSAIEAQGKYETIERESKESYEIKLAKGIKYNSKQFYAYLRSKKKSNPTVSKLKKPNGEFTTSVKESADLLVKSFATVFTNETSLTRDCNMDIIAVEQIDPLITSDYDVRNELLALNVSKCAGTDGVHPKIVRILAGNDNFVSAVTAIYRSISDVRQFPEAWKRAIIIALHKMGAFIDAGNYRPISLTCILCKVYEKLLFKHLYSHVKGFISWNQHGFMEGSLVSLTCSNHYYILSLFWIVMILLILYIWIFKKRLIRLHTKDCC